MYSTTAYLYQQRTRVLLIDTSGAYFTARYDPVYAKKLTINKGVDNVLLFEFINQDEKPVNVTGSTFVFRLISTDGAELLLEKPMTILNAATGRAKVTIDADDLYAIQAQPASYSIQRASGNLVEAVFTDAQSGARAPVDVVDSIQPQFVPSSELTIPTVNLGAAGGVGSGQQQGSWPDWSLQAAGYNANYVYTYQNTEFYSSFIEPRGPVTTIQMNLVQYTGTIKVQAAENYQSVWYNVTESTTHLNETGVHHITVVGWHPILRVVFNNAVAASPQGPGQAAVIGQVNTTDGVVTSITVQSGGRGYLAPPRVNIVGNGAGARAVATLGSEGSVASITVVDGGSGYWPIPPTMQGATALIDTGYIENLLYR